MPVTEVGSGPAGGVTIRVAGGLRGFLAAVEEGDAACVGGGTETLARDAVSTAAAENSGGDTSARGVRIGEAIALPATLPTAAGAGLKAWRLADWEQSLMGSGGF